MTEDRATGDGTTGDAPTDDVPTDDGSTDDPPTDPDRRQRLHRLLDGYFDTKTQELVRGLLATASGGQVEDDDAMDELFDEFVGLLEDRYDRDDPGWRDDAVAFLRAEFDRQVEQIRTSRRRLEQQLAEQQPTDEQPTDGEPRPPTPGSPPR